MLCCLFINCSKIKTARGLSPTSTLTTASGLAVSRYGLGGAARTTQPSNLVSRYVDILLQEKHDDGAPFLFYYNPHRYPKFMAGIQQICSDVENRKNLFVASGGHDLTISGLDQRLDDCLKYCGGDYLDLFVLEYILPSELIPLNDKDDGSFEPGPKLVSALQHITQTWLKQQKRIRYIGISTHSHVVGKVISECFPEVNIVMLRYGMSHKEAAEKISFPAARANKKTILVFTSTRWNSLLEPKEDNTSPPPPTSADCLSFVFGSDASPSPVHAVLHSARDETELMESMSGLRHLTEEESQKWRNYGEPMEVSNDDYFDEFPEERLLVAKD